MYYENISSYNIDVDNANSFREAKCRLVSSQLKNFSQSTPLLLRFRSKSFQFKSIFLIVSCNKIKRLLDVFSRLISLFSHPSIYSLCLIRFSHILFQNHISLWYLIVISFYAFYSYEKSFHFVFKMSFVFRYSLLFLFSRSLLLMFVLAFLILFFTYNLSFNATFFYLLSVNVQTSQLLLVGRLFHQGDLRL